MTREAVTEAEAASRVLRNSLGIQINTTCELDSQFLKEIAQ